MGFIKPSLPEVDFEEWARQPHARRIRPAMQHWVENGFGTPRAIYVLYGVKCALYVLIAAAVIAATPGIGGLREFDQWWTEPVVYQKLIVFTLLWEVLGMGCGWGPLSARFWPSMGACLYWLRPNTIRLAPWPNKVPLTGGTRRTAFDVALYAGVLASAVWLLTRPADGVSVTADGDLGVLDPVNTLPLIACLGLLGLRDKTIFLAARGEHYWLKLFLFFLPFVDMMVGFQLVMLALWWGAATSKINHHFPYVIAIMESNSIFNPKWAKRLLYKDPENDLRPSWIPSALAHIGTASEYLVPLYLVFFADGGTFTWVAIVYMLLFHLHILSTVPIGVPLEWNIFFLFSIVYLFGSHGDIDPWDVTNPVTLLVLIPLVVLPVWGNIDPRAVSFLPAMRYYAGNWATSAWFFKGDAEDRLEEKLVTSCKLPKNQLAMMYDPQTVALMASKIQAWRSMHTHGRAHNGLAQRVVGDGEGWEIREGETVAGFALGWNFGEGHLHNSQLLKAIQARCDFEAGEVRVMVLESQPIHQGTQHYEIWDAKLGLLEEGDVLVSDMLTRQPWVDESEEYPVHNVRTYQPLAGEEVVSE